jgi:hypothetical protein
MRFDNPLRMDNLTGLESLTRLGADPRSGPGAWVHQATKPFPGSQTPQIRHPDLNYLGPCGLVSIWKKLT